ncbi:MAG TPA: SufD family Fe-S cluster assembly protein [Sphingomonadaceae bacterium]|nr:SufD family Fe-S cluster assembly protein [Sphingomonadaceae bacterium]
MLLELPSNRAEAWRWSDLSQLPTHAAATPTGEVPTALPWLLGEGPRLLFVDGVFDAGRSAPGDVTLGGVALDGGSHALARLAGTTGWRLNLGRGHAASGLVQIIHLTTGGDDHLAAEIVLGEDAQASVLETFIGRGWTNRLTRIDLARSARLMLARRLLGDNGFVSTVDRAEVGQGASLTMTSLAAGGTDSRFDGHVTLTGTGAYAEANGALLARGRERHDVNLVLRHAEPDGSSHQSWRSVADNRATVSVAARIEVARGAQKTDAVQSLKGLLLARTGTINAKPELEIFADDVKCAHGATVGELDRNVLFYLQSRGVPLAEAKALLTQAFVAGAIDRIGDEAVRSAFEADVANWFAKAPPLEGRGWGGAVSSQTDDGRAVLTLAPTPTPPLKGRG